MGNQVQTIDQPKEIQAAITPSQMLQIAVEQNADIDKLEKLMQLQERWDAAQAKKAFVSAMSAFRSECPAIEKTKSGHNTKYAGLAESIDQIKGLLAKCGLSHSWQTSQEGDLVTVTCTVTHLEGHSEKTMLAAGPDSTGSKNSIQAIGSTVSYLQRYTLFAILGLASQEMDNDGNPETPQGVISAFQSAESMEKLHMLFREAWNTYPLARKELTLLKDAKKKELSQ